MKFNTYQEAQAAWLEDAAQLEAGGVYLNGATTYLPEAWRANSDLAMDAQPSLVTSASGALPALLTTSIDPEVIHVLFAPSKAAKIVGEKRKGTWLDETMLFPIAENTGEVSSYGDYNSNGSADVNLNWPNRQAYLFQTVEQFGDREIERAGLGKINLVAEKGVSSATALTKFQNLTYFFGVSGLQCYGLLNDPTLPASITPTTKAYATAKTWFYNGTIQATANEIFADIQNLFNQLVIQSGGLVEAEDKLVLALSPSNAVALKTTNAYGITVFKMLEAFPNLRIETAVQYGAVSAANSQGLAAGNMMQMIAESVEGQETAFCAFNEKQRSHPMVRDISSYKQKKTAGTWGTVIRQPFAIASMLGI